MRPGPILGVLLILLLIPLLIIVLHSYHYWRYGGDYSASNESILKVDISEYLDEPISTIKHDGPFWINGTMLYVDILKLMEKKLPFDIVDFFPRSQKQNFATYNNEGIRALRDYTIDKGNRTRIIMLGDSFVWGSWVKDNETSSYYLEQMLGSADVINLGVFSHNTKKEVERFELKGLKYNSDIVAVFYLYNDMWDSEIENRIYYHLPVFIETFGFSNSDVYNIKVGTAITYGESLDFSKSFQQFVEEPLSRLNEMSKNNSFEVILLAYPAPPEHILKLTRIAKKFSWNLIDLGEAINYGQGANWSLWDGHPTAYANRRVATFLSDFLFEKKYIAN